MSLVLEDMARLLGELDQKVARLGLEGDPLRQYVTDLWDCHRDLADAERLAADNLMDATERWPADPKWEGATSL